MEDFVTYELAVKLKEKGFKEECSARYYCRDKGYFERNSYNPDTESVFYYYNNDEDLGRFYLDAPTISQVINWLESTKKIFLTVDIEPMGFFFIINYDILTNENGEYEFKIYNSTNTYPSSFDAAIEGINYILNNFI